MGSLETTHERSVIGKTEWNNMAGTATTITLVSDPGSVGPKRFMILADGDDVYLRQGGSGLTAATTNSYKLKAGTTITVTVDSLENNTISHLRVTTNAVVRFTDVSSLDPGDGIDITGNVML